MIDIRLKVFQSVARNMSFSKAGRELFISQPAVSKHIQELEKEYNAVLFERLAGKIRITPAGQLLLDHCNTIIKEYEKMDFDMHALRKRYSGELRIGASTTIAQYVLPEILAKFRHDYPQIHISIFNGNSLEIEDELQNNQIDIGMVEGILHQPQLKYTPFMKDELVAFVSTKNPLAEQDEITVEKLREIPLVIRERGSGTLDVIEQCLSKLGVPISDLNIELSFGTTEGIKHYVENTNSMGIVSIQAVSEGMLLGKYKLMDVEGLKMNRQFCMVEKRGETEGPTKIFRTFITKSYKS